MPEILTEQTRSTSIALLFDLPQTVIKRNLRARIQATNATFTNIFFTRLILSFEFFIRESVNALTFLERWYTNMNVPVIKRSQIKDKLDHDEATGNIRWTQHSIDVLLQVIKQAAEQRRSPLPTIDQSLIPWRIVRQTHLCLP
ncbi:unnamed protein product [Rotaria sp. Silwood1]|nr:unnamed protein product [Rotaria sp. Silwood1]